MTNAYHYQHNFNDDLAKEFRNILSVPFSPNQLDRLQLWLDGDDSNTITKDGGDKVSQWDDKSGNDNHATQGTAANQPTYVTSSFEGKGSIEAVDTHSLLLPHFDNMSAGATVFAVLRTDQDNSLNTWGNIVNINNSGTGSERQPLIYLKKNDATRLINFSAGNIDALIYGSSYLSNGDSLIATYKTDGSMMYSYLNGENMKSSAVIFLQAGGTSSLLSATKGNLAEVIIYDRELNDSERKQVEIYLADKWGLYHPNATWILSYPVPIQAAIHNAKLNKSEVVTLANPLVAWFEASDINSIIKDGNGKVSQWNDKSGQSNHAIQATVTNRPVYNVRQQNSFATLEFAGAEFLTTSTFAAILSQPNTIFVVGKRDTTAIDNYFYDGLTSLNRNAMLVSGTGKYQIFAGVGLAGSAVTTMPEVHSTIFNGVSTESYINGVLDISGIEGTQSLDGLTIGAAYGLWGKLDGFIAEIIIYDSLLSTAQRQQVENYLYEKWGIV